MEVEERAQEHEAKEWEARNAPREPAPTYQAGDAGYGPEECGTCGAEMPAVRRAMGSHVCVHCKAEEERQAARGPRR